MPSILFIFPSVASEIQPFISSTTFSSEKSRVSTNVLNTSLLVDIKSSLKTLPIKELIQMELLFLSFTSWLSSLKYFNKYL